MKDTRRVAIVVATFVAFSLVVATFLLAAAEDIDQPGGQRRGSFRARFKLTKLKDFTQFKKIYHKVYRSLTENSRRAKLYLKRALNVFKNNIRYLKRRTSKFLKINPTSDWTEKERESIFSALTPSAMRRKRSAAIVTAGEQTNTKNRRRVGRSKAGRRRSMSQRLRLFMRRKSHRSQKTRRGASNSNEPSRTNEPHLRLDSSTRIPSKSSDDSWSPSERVDADDRAGDDRVLLDYRDTDCLLEPKSQKKCGACYIFSATALFEYQHCRQTGKLVAFSEQYAIDCGRRASLRGCDGGLEAWAANFFARYGMETARKYPFRAADQTCPYGRASRHETMGRVRANEARLVAIDYAQLKGPDELQTLLETRGPLTISLYKLHDFADYGGGVDLVSSCSKSGGHAMVLIGHGREDGLDYWLIRNSHGGEWGLGGHYKLAKRSNPECIMRVGYLDGMPKFELNKANNEVKTLLKKSSKREKNPLISAL